MKKVKLTFKTPEKTKKDNEKTKIKKYNRSTITEKEKEELFFEMAMQLGLLED